MIFSNQGPLSDLFLSLLGPLSLLVSSPNTTHKQIINMKLLLYVFLLFVKIDQYDMTYEHMVYTCTIQIILHTETFEEKSIIILSKSFKRQSIIVFKE